MDMVGIGFVLPLHNVKLHPVVGVDQGIDGCRFTGPSLTESVGGVGRQAFKGRGRNSLIIVMADLTG